MTSEDINRLRRYAIGAAAMTAAASQLGIIGTAKAQSAKPAAKRLPDVKPGAHTSFGPLKQIDAGVLNVSYAEVGPADGKPVILLHGWPYDIYSFVDVAPLLASAGYRVIIPYVRGYGATRFLSTDSVRNAQPSALASDTTALMDALKIEKATLAGFDWGARTADIVAAMWPERVKALVSVSGYLIGNQETGKAPLPPAAELQWWYQFYFATERGRIGYDKYRKEFSKLIWQIASPKWQFDDATFARSAAAFENPYQSAPTDKVWPISWSVRDWIDFSFFISLEAFDSASHELAEAAFRLLPYGLSNMSTSSSVPMDPFANRTPRHLTAVPPATDRDLAWYRGHEASCVFATLGKSSRARRALPNPSQAFRPRAPSASRRLGCRCHRQRDSYDKAS